MSNTFTGSYADGSPLTKAMLDTAYQTLQLDIANTALTTTGSTTGQALMSNGSGLASSFQTIPDPQGPFSLRNYGLKATVASGVMTVSLKTKALTDPSGTDMVNFNYSTNATTSATYTTVNVSAATTIPVNSSASLGFSATSTARVFVYGYYNSVTTSVKLAVSARSDLDNGYAASVTAISASADSAQSIYATATLSVIPRLLGYVEAAHNSAGAWQTPTKVALTNQILNEQGTFTITAVHFSVVQTGTASYVKQGNAVTLFLPAISGTSDNAAFTLTGMPSQIRPTTLTLTSSIVVTDNGSTASGPGYASIATSGTITMFPNVTTNNWTASGTKGFQAITVSYLLI